MWQRLSPRRSRKNAYEIQNMGWLIQLSAGDGIVEVQVLIEYAKNLPASLPAPNNPETALVYGVSVFHQLHCLLWRSSSFSAEISDCGARISFGLLTTPRPGRTSSLNEIVFHRDHCLDYIRQALMCNADASFEPLTSVGINGMGAVHQCRDFNKIFSWAYEHRSDKVHGSGYGGGKVTHTPGYRNDFEEKAESGHHH
jgi:hypothetical protein